jgi:hypothetical protein
MDAAGFFICRGKAMLKSELEAKVDKLEAELAQRQDAELVSGPVFEVNTTQGRYFVRANSQAEARMMAQGFLQKRARVEGVNEVEAALITWYAPPSEPTVNRAQAAAIANVAHQTVTYWCQEGHISMLPNGRIRLSDLAKHMQLRTVKAGR